MISFYKVLMVLPAILLLQNSCAQNTKNKENMGTEYRDKIKNIYKEVKKYEYNPTYQLKVNSNLCTYEIYINEMLVDYSFTTGRPRWRGYVSTYDSADLQPPMARIYLYVR
jgi:hypothetical protein